MYWGYLVFPEHYRDKPAGFHMQMIDAVCRYKKIAIVAPREHAKSTLISFLYVLHSVCFGKKRFVVMFSDTKDKAANFLDRIRTELQENELLHFLHGKPIFIKDSAYDIVFRFPNGHKIRITSRGEDGIQHIRGEIKGAYRPDLMVFDDVEYQELVDSPERRQKLKNDFNQAALPAGDVKLCQYIAIGTVLHFDALISNLVSEDQYRDWYKLFYRACISESTQEVLWSDRITFKYLMQKKQDDPIGYAKEYQNNPISGENATFQSKHFRYWRQENDGYVLSDNQGNMCGKGMFRDCVPAIACDLAWSAKKTADETVIMGALLTPNNDIIIWNYLHERGMRPERYSELLFGMIKTLHELTGTIPKVGIEKAMLERVSQHFLKIEMKRKDEFFIFKDLKWESDKISRITISLEARYANGTIYHRHGMGHLEDQLIQFPYAAHDDIVDAEAGVVSMLKYPKSAKSLSSNQSDDTEFDWVCENMLPKRDKVGFASIGTFNYGKPKGHKRAYTFLH